MITFKKYKSKLKVIPRGSHTLVQVNGKSIAYLDDTTSSIVELNPTSNTELEMLYYVCDQLGYSHKSYSSQSYEQKKNLKHLSSTINIS